MSITTENWDGVIAPSIAIGGWTVQTGWTTETGTYYSSPNGIGTAANFSGYKTLTFDTLDGVGGDASVSARFWLDNSYRDNYGGVVLRCDSTPIDFSTSEFYFLEVRNEDWSAGNWSILISKSVGGVLTSLAYITGIATSYIHTQWFKVTLTGSGTSLSATLQRESDGYYLQTDGTFAATLANCLTTTDGTITGAGYSGVYAWGWTSHGSPVYTDDFSLDAVGGSINVSISAGFLGGSAAIAAASSLQIDSTIAVGSVYGSGALGDNPLAALPLAATGVLSPANILVPPSLFVFPLPLAATGVLVTTFSVSAGTTFSVSPLASTGVLSSIAVVDEVGISIGVGPLIGHGTLGAVRVWTNWTGEGLVYDIYGNDGAGGGIDYGTLVDATASLTWSPGALSYPADYQWAVRTYSLLSGLEEKNIDVKIRLILDASGADITNRPTSPTGLRAISRASAAIRIEWTCVASPIALKRPTGFKVYVGTGGAVSYVTPAATVAYSGSSNGSTTLTGLTDGTEYSIAVRAYNASGEDQNTSFVNCVADATGPDAVLSLSSEAVAV